MIAASCLVEKVEDLCYGGGFEACFFHQFGAGEDLSRWSISEDTPSVQYVESIGEEGDYVSIVSGGDECDPLVSVEIIEDC